MPDRSLQSQLDTITSQTRALVQPERLAITDASVQDLLASGLESHILPIGATAPTFALPDAINGKLIRSSDLLAVGPLIITFFRGRWCPYCMTELEAWQAAFPTVRERGALVVAISPQLPRQNDFTVQQHHLTFPLLTDAGCRLATPLPQHPHQHPLHQRHPARVRRHRRDLAPPPASHLRHQPGQHGPLRRSPRRPPCPPRPSGRARRPISSPRSPAASTNHGHQSARARRRQFHRDRRLLRGRHSHKPLRR